MRFTKLVITMLTIMSSMVLSQVSWWQPQFPISGDTLTINVDPTQSGNIPNTTTNLVLHWGVNESGAGQWTTPPNSIWPTGTVLHSDGVAARSPMTRIADTLWSIQVPTDGSIQTLHYVFNTGTPSSPGANWENNGGNNWNVTFFQSQLAPVVIEPQVEVLYGEPERSPLFVELNETVSIVASAVVNGVTLASLELQQNGVSLTTVTTDTINYDFLATTTGMQRFDVIAEATSGFRDTTGFSVMVNPAIVDAPPPAGTQDGVNQVSSTLVTMALFAPEKSFVYLVGDFNDWKVDDTYFMNRHQPSADSTLWWISLPNLDAGEEYAFQYLIDGEIRIGDPYSQKILDPWNDGFIPGVTYPNLKAYPAGKTAEAVTAFTMDPASFQWTYTDTFSRPAPQDLVIYEMLVRDFIARHDYITLLDTLDYLQNLGINAIELMPVTEFEGNESWGYNPSFPFALDKYYGTADAFKTFIDECHRRGMAVILDVVLNHVYGQSPYARMYWNPALNRPAANNPWLNEVSPNQTFSFGNDFNHSSIHTRAFVDRFNRYWLEEYRIDGYRFDFTKGFTQVPGDGGGFDQSRINNLKRMADRMWEVDSTAYVILEHFAPNDEEKILAEHGNGMMLWGNANFNYNEATMGYHDGGKSDFSWGYYGNRNWTVPNLVTYMESHDEERLMYKNLQFGNSAGNYNVQDQVTALNRIKLAAAFFLTYPGPKMIWQFGELGYDISIDDPCRVCNKPILWNYQNNIDRDRLYRTYAALLKIRRENAVFRDAATQVTMSVANATKRIALQHPDLNVNIIGNFDVVARDITPNFLYPTTWYDYFSGDSSLILNTGDPINLQPGEFRIYTDQKLETPDPDLLTSVKEPATNAVAKFELHDSYPNPFNPATNIRFDVAERSRIFVAIYNVLGERVKILQDGAVSVGAHQISWNGRSDDGAAVTSGLYFVRMEAGGFSKTRRILLVK